MTFEEWWKDYIKEFGELKVVYLAEVKYHAYQSWNKAVNVMIEQEEKSFFRFCENPDCRHFRN